VHHFIAGISPTMRPPSSWPSSTTPAGGSWSWPTSVSGATRLLLPGVKVGRALRRVKFRGAIHVAEQDEPLPPIAIAQVGGVQLALAL
jgi:hypothetical protein